MMMLTVASIFFFLMIRRPPRSTLFPTRRSSDLNKLIFMFGAEPSQLFVPHLDYIMQRHGRIFYGLGADYVDRKSTRLNSSHSQISYAVFCLKKKNHSH